jgi:8-oxo-dGTP pyrophosphatase MutT (NUDIX family)
MRTRVVAGVVDVVVLKPWPDEGPAISGRRSRDPWQVLTLQRGPDTRCTGAWEIVHGRIEGGEKAEDAAVREVLEETGLVTRALYNVTVNGFYLHRISTVQLSLVFAAIVDDTAVTLGREHAASRWRTFTAASRQLAWPREREALGHVQQLLRHGNAGPVEDVLRIF